jgi:LPXTG-site transpeptidase (sortase) family protein
MTIRARKHSLVPGYQTKISFSRHIMPPLLGIITIAALLAVFNMPYLVARFHYESKASAAPIPATSVSPSTPIYKPKENRVIIDKINVNAPVIYDQTSTESAVFQKALQDGVVHYGTTALPGQAGNVALFGHSSGAPWHPGNYKFVFTLLDKLTPGDDITIDYNGTRYTYRVTSKAIVSPDNLNILIAKDPSRHSLELITCTPVGTSKNRLVVHTEQVFPAVK